VFAAHYKNTFSALSLEKRMKTRYPDKIEAFRRYHPEVFSYIAHSTAFEIFIEAETRLLRDFVFTGEVTYRYDQGAYIFSGGDGEEVWGSFHRSFNAEFHLEYWTEMVRRRKRHPRDFGLFYGNMEIGLTLPEWARLIELPSLNRLKIAATPAELARLAHKPLYVVPGLYFTPFKKRDEVCWEIRIILGHPPYEQIEDRLDREMYQEMYALWQALIREFRKALPFKEEFLIGQLITSEFVPDTQRDRVWTLIDKALDVRF
jgi:hypothetical protein